MDMTIKMIAELLVYEAERLLKDHGLASEGKVLEMIKMASSLIWNNADPATDEYWVHWITSKELYVAECIGELHKEAAKKYLGS